MSLTAPNSSEFPRVPPWQCFTCERFDPGNLQQRAPPEGEQ